MIKEQVFNTYCAILGSFFVRVGNAVATWIKKNPVFPSSTTSSSSTSALAGSAGLPEGLTQDDANPNDKGSMKKDGASSVGG